MNITSSITLGMTPQEKEIYFAHMEKRHREEAEYIQAQRERTIEYKKLLIEDVLKYRPEFTREQLQKMSIRRLEVL